MSEPGRPLTGRRIVVTRARAQATALAEDLARRGAQVVELPVIAVCDPDDGGRALRSAADRAADGRYRWIVCTSHNGVARLLGALDGRPLPAGVRWAAVGRTTAQAMAEAGLAVDLVPDGGGADALAAAFPPPDPPVPGAGAGVLYPRAETVAGDLAGTLRTRGWPVDDVVAYRTAAGRPDPAAAAAAARADAVAFTSSSTVTRTVGLLGRDGLPPVVVTIGPTTSATARELGLAVTAEAMPHTVAGLAEAVERALAGPARRP